MLRVFDAGLSGKACLLQAQQAWHSAALGIAKVAALELPEDRWPELIPALMNNMQAQDAAVKQATLETLGYVCEEAVALEEEVFAQEQVNHILTAVVTGMQSSQSDAVRLAAIVALQNALEFAETNFETARERDYIMQVVCEGTQAADLRVREAAFECLAGIASLHYHKLQPYITEIFSLTQQAINTGEEQVAKQAIEFWCTICDEELELDGVSLPAQSPAQGQQAWRAPQSCLCKCPRASRRC